ncbi:MAG: methyl-accepting chemotaxis protein [Planctomycetaceae bacterium]|jgi:methyl-accepting chemotaxis protein|nr:methyl-accepting chemotaxis protein [Planctomycetaceae bacterium]
MFNRLRIGKKLILSFGIVIFLLLAITIVTAYSYLSIMTSTERITRQIDAATDISSAMELAHKMQSDVLVYMNTHDPKLSSLYDSELKSTVEMIQKVKSDSDSQDKLGLCEKILTSLEEAKTGKTAYLAQEEKVASARKEYLDTYDQLVNIIRKTTTSVNDLIAKSVTENADGESLVALPKHEVADLLRQCDGFLGNIALSRVNIATAWNEQEREDETKELQGNFQKLKSLIEEVKPLLPEGEISKQFAQFTELFNNWVGMGARYMDQLKNFDNSQKSLLTRIEDAVAQSSELSNVVAKISAEEGLKQRNVIAVSKYAAYAASAIAILVAVVMGCLLARSVAGGISGIVEIFRKITGEGDTEVTISDTYLKRGDEVGELAQQAKAIINDYHSITEVGQSAGRGDWTYKVKIKGEKDAMNKNLAVMFDQVNEVLSQVRGAVHQVSTGASQVAATSESLSQGATESAASLEEITSSMTEMGTQTHQNAQNAAEASNLAKDASTAAGSGQEMMKQMINSMEQITKNSQDVQKVIKVIDDISFQTNLLALNAAVEAARAGVHGKGFAVVAEEVRNLAARCAKAAGETTQMIENNNRQINDGAEIAQRTAEMLDQIVSHVSSTTNLINEIATASNEQAQGVNQVTQALQQIDTVTQQNTASAEESASASREMSDHAARLQEVVARFKLRGTQAAGKSIPTTSEANNFRSRTPSPIRPAVKKTVQKSASFGSSEDNWGGGNSSVAVAESDYNFKLDDSEFGRY